MPPDPESRSRRVLIVDDDQAFAGSLAQRIGAHGYEAAVAASLRETLAAFGDFSPSIVIFDSRAAPRMSADLVAQLREARPGLLCVGMAAEADRDCVIEAFRKGAHEFFDKTGAFAEVLAILERCVKRRQIEAASEEGYDALRRAKEAAEAANKAKSEFLATMSHELRTPLNAIIGFSEVMMHSVLGPVGNEKYLAYIKDIHQSGRHLLSIINDILDFSKVESGKLELFETEVKLRQLVDSLLRWIGPKAADAGLTLCERIPEDLPSLWCDETKLKQMLLNLLSNAVKFTAAGGRIELEAEHGSEGLTITVRDTGIGIAKADLPRVLQPFVQVDNSLSRKHEGTGLGLTLVKSIVEIHGGSLKLESEFGQGTTAQLTFPPDRICRSIARPLAAAG